MVFAIFFEITLAMKKPICFIEFSKKKPEQTGENCYLIRCLVTISEKIRPRKTPGFASLSRVFGIKL